MPSVIVLVSAPAGEESPEISDFYSVEPPEGRAVIVFDDAERLEEVRSAVNDWARSDGLFAATLDVSADTSAEAVDLLRQMFPPLANLRFLLDDDPFVDELIQHIRQSRRTG
jgi:hypothetical protein